MALVCIHGLMEENIMENINMIKNMAKEYIYGLMESNIMEVGLMVFSMEKLFLQIQLEKVEEAYGKMESVLNG